MPSKLSPRSKSVKAWLWNGRQFKPARSLPISDRSCRYGMALFESFPILNGHPIFLEAHLSRLKAACIQCGFHLDLNALGRIVETLGSISYDAFARIYVTAGDGTPTSAATECRVFLMAEPRTPFPEAVLQQGFSVTVHQPAHHSLFGGLKTANYWTHVHAKQLAMERQSHEALLFNGRQELVSASMANVFVVGKTGIRTPALACGARDGVMRRWVLDRCEARECPLGMEDLRNAEEIFLTSSGIGIMPVTMLEGSRLASRKVATPLQNEYRAYLSSLLRR